MVIDADTLLFFEQQPAALPLYEAFYDAVLKRHPDARIKIQKTQISFSNRYIFACVSFLRVKKKKELPDPYLVITLGCRIRWSRPAWQSRRSPIPGGGRPISLSEAKKRWMRSCLAGRTKRTASRGENKFRK